MRINDTAIGDITQDSSQLTENQKMAMVGHLGMMRNLHSVFAHNGS